MSKLADLKPAHFLWEVDRRIARLRLSRPERKNPLTFESYAELRDTFRELVYAEDIDAVVILPNGGNFCSGGDVHDIIGPLIDMDMKALLAFTRMTGDLVKAMIHCGKPVIWPWTASLLVQEPSSRWPRTSGWRRLRRKPHFSSRALDWPAATWAPAQCCRGSSVRARGGTAVHRPHDER